MNELDKLRQMLTDAKIPFESRQEKWDEQAQIPPFAKEEYGEACKWRRNQVIYGRAEHCGDYMWQWDGICQYGSYGAKDGMIESYGVLGADSEGYPMVVTAEEAFATIKAHYDGRNEDVGA